jgi:hypothetical protein
MSWNWAIFGFAAGYVVGGLFGLWDNIRVDRLLRVAVRRPGAGDRDIGRGRAEIEPDD